MQSPLRPRASIVLDTTHWECAQGVIIVPSHTSVGHHNVRLGANTAADAYALFDCSLEPKTATSKVYELEPKTAQSKVYELEPKLQQSKVYELEPKTATEQSL
jgi:hypothetical protein